MKLRHLVLVNAALLISTGVLFWSALVDLLLEGYGFPPGHLTGTVTDGSGQGYAPHALGRLLGVVCFGFGLLLLALHDVGDSRFGRRVTGALCAANAAGLLVALTQQITIWESTLGWLTAGAFLLMALGYGTLLAAHRSPAAVHQEPRPMPQTS